MLTIMAHTKKAKKARNDPMAHPGDGTEWAKKTDQKRLAALRMYLEEVSAPKSFFSPYTKSVNIHDRDSSNMLMRDVIARQISICLVGDRECEYIYLYQVISNANGNESLESLNFRAYTFVASAQASDTAGRLKLVNSPKNGRNAPCVSECTTTQEVPEANLEEEDDGPF